VALGFVFNLVFKGDIVAPYLAVPEECKQNNDRNRHVDPHVVEEVLKRKV
jgi:hypothetical protein